MEPLKLGIWMIGFFDTNIYVDYLKGIFPKDLYRQYFERFIIRISPVVYEELIRCLRSEELKKKVEEMVEKIIFLAPPTTKMWIRAGELAGKVTGSYDEQSLAKIQNDLLIALTAHQDGATLITQDRHFQAIQKHLSFRLILHSTKTSH